MEHKLSFLLFMIFFYACSEPVKKEDPKKEAEDPKTILTDVNDTLASSGSTEVGKKDNSVMYKPPVDLNGLYGSWSAANCLEKNMVNTPPAAYSLLMNRDGTYQLTINAGYISKGVYKINGDTMSFTEKERFSTNEETGAKIVMEFPRSPRQCIFELQTGLALCFTPISEVIDNFPEKCYCR